MPDPLPLVERLRPLIEPLSDYAHEAWAGWMRYLFNKSAPLNEDGTVTIPKWAVERWLRQSAASYAELPEAEKESDRDEARKMLAIVEPALREAAAALEAREADETHKAIDRLLAFCLSDNEPQSRYKFSFGIEYSCIVDFVVDLTPRAHHPLARQYPAYQTQSGNFAKAVNAAIDAAIDGLPASAPGVAPRLPDGEPRTPAAPPPDPSSTVPEEKRIIPTGEDCFLCGAELDLHTNAPQECEGNRDDPPCEHHYHGYDGDAAICPECGAKAWLSCDGETAYVTWDETDPHNVAIAERREAEAPGTAEDGPATHSEASAVPQDQGATQNPQEAP